MSSYSQFFGGASSGGGEPVSINSFQPFYFSSTDNPPGWNASQKKYIDPVTGAIYLETGKQEIDSGSVYQYATKTAGFLAAPDNKFWDYTSEIAAPTLPGVRSDESGSLILTNGPVMYKYAANPPFGYTGTSLDLDQVSGTPNRYIAHSGKFHYGVTPGPSDAVTIKGFDFQGNINSTSGPWDLGPHSPYPSNFSLGGGNYGYDGSNEGGFARWVQGSVNPAQRFARYQRSWNSPTSTFSAGSTTTQSYPGTGVVFGSGNRRHQILQGTAIYDWRGINDTATPTTGPLAGIPIDLPAILGGPAQRTAGSKGSDAIWTMYNATASLVTLDNVNVGTTVTKTDTDSGYKLYLRID